MERPIHQISFRIGGWRSVFGDLIKFGMGIRLR